MSVIRARFDGKVFVPEGPVDCPKNTPLRLVVIGDGKDGEPAGPVGVRDTDRAGQVAQLRALLGATQELGAARQISEEEIAAEISAYRASRP